MRVADIPSIMDSNSYCGHLKYCPSHKNIAIPMKIIMSECSKAPKKDITTANATIIMNFFILWLAISDHSSFICVMSLSIIIA